MHCYENDITLLSTINTIEYDPLNLVNRTKGQKLSCDQLIFLRSQLDEYGETVSSLSRKYLISTSTLSRINQMSDVDFDRRPLRNYSKIPDDKRSFISEKIYNYYLKIDCEFTTVDIQKYLFNEFEILWPQRLIGEIMKSDLKLTYKRCTSLPNCVNFDKVNSLRWGFAVDFSNKLKKNILIWNIDEWTISRTTKCNYSWSLKGLNKETKNTPFSGSLYLILEVLSNGCWYLLLTNKQIDSIVFCHFVNKISIWIKENQMFNFADTVLNKNSYWIMK